jgi:hypothetical protein
LVKNEWLFPSTPHVPPWSTQGKLYPSHIPQNRPLPYTDGSKQEKGVGSGVAIFKGSNMVAKSRLKLNTRCSNNQAEQFAIFKALDTIESLDTNTINPRTAIIYS